MKSIVLMKPVLLSMALVLSLCACTAKEKERQYIKSIVFPLSDDVKTVDPANAFDSISLTVMPLVLESLYQYSYLKRPLQLEPLLAEGMPQISKDRKTYTISIKKGVFYTDSPAFPGGKGRELAAEDFIYQWKRLLHPGLKSNGPWIFENKVVGYSELKEKLRKHSDPDTALLESSIEGFKAIDKYTIQIKLIKPYPQLLYVLAMGFTVPLPPEVVKKYGQNGLNQRMVGTGPYFLKEFFYGSKIILEKSESFRGELYPSKKGEYAGKALPFLERIEFRISKEESPMWLNFQKGKFDVTSIPKDNFQSAITPDKKLSPEMKRKGIQLYTYNMPRIWYLDFNMKDEILGKNRNLRRAIARAIDRDYIIETFANGRATKATSIVPPGIEGHTKRKKLIGDYDLEKAKYYLKLAGYPDGANLPTLRLDLRSLSTSIRQRGEYMKQALAKIGVSIEVIPNTFPKYLEKLKDGNIQITIGGWGADYPDPENFLQLLFSKNVSPGPNSSNFVDSNFDKLYLKIAGMARSPEKQKLIYQAEDIVFKKEAAWSMLYYPKGFVLTHKWVKNYFPTQIILNDLKYIDVDMQERAALLKKF